MTIIEAISQVDSLKPNTYSTRQKLLWLSQLEALVKNQIIDAQCGTDPQPFPGFTGDTDTQTQLLMPAPFDGAYLYWLEAQIHYANEDISLYNSAITLFTDAYRAFQAHHRNSRATRSYGRFRF